MAVQFRLDSNFAKRPLTILPQKHSPAVQEEFSPDTATDRDIFKMYHNVKWIGWDRTRRGHQWEKHNWEYSMAHTPEVTPISFLAYGPDEKFSLDWMGTIFGSSIWLYYTSMGSPAHTHKNRAHFSSMSHHFCYNHIANSNDSGLHLSGGDWGH